MRKACRHALKHAEFRWDKKMGTIPGVVFTAHFAEIHHLVLPDKLSPFFGWNEWTWWVILPTLCLREAFQWTLPCADRTWVKNPLGELELLILCTFCKQLQGLLWSEQSLEEEVRIRLPPGFWRFPESWDQEHCAAGRQGTAGRRVPVCLVESKGTDSETAEQPTAAIRKLAMSWRENSKEFVSVKCLLPFSFQSITAWKAKSVLWLGTREGLASLLPWTDLLSGQNS